MIDEENISSLGKGIDGYYFEVCLSVALVQENLGHDLLEVVLFADRLYLFQVLDVLLYLLDVTFFLPPKHIRLPLPSHHDRDQQHFLSHEDKFQLGRTPVNHGTHPRKLKLVKLKTILLVDEFVASLVDCVAVDVVFS